MIIKLVGNPHFTGEFYKTQFVDGVSQDHVNQHTFDLIRDILGLEPIVISPDVECSKCEAYKLQIAELEARLKKVKK